MSVPRPESQVTQHPFASEPFELATLRLQRRNGKLERLQGLRTRFREAAESLMIDHEVDRIRSVTRANALDEDFSVAVRERWQTWSRNANPFRTELASSAASELKNTAGSDSESDASSTGSATEDADEQAEIENPSKRKRRKAFRVEEIKIKVGDSELEMTEGWDAIRREREARLTELDAALPSAFRFDERQLQVYAHRLKPKYINSLDRPFEVHDVQRLLRRSHRVSDAQTTSASSAASIDAELFPPSVLIISFFTSSINFGKDEATWDNPDPSRSSHELDGDSTRDDYVKRICGDGIGGMKRSQTVELLSSQTLSDLQGSLFCWSDEQPERCDWRQRLKRQRGRPGEAHRSGGATSDMCGETQQEGDCDTDASSEDARDDRDDQNRDPRFARFTGQRRQTDTVLVIENKLYSKGLRHGDASEQADYATLFGRWKAASGHDHASAGWTGKGGDLSVSFEQLKSLRVGQPYWLLHQGDCVHCFVIEQIRAIRPGEQKMLAERSKATTPLESVPRNSASIGFPRITWLSTPTMLRFAADNKESYSLGHHILLWEDQARPACDTFPEQAGSSREVESSQPSNAWQIASGRTKRKDEGLLRKKQGKCLACSLRKAQVGILGGNRVRLPLSSARGHNDDDAATQDESIISGTDDHLITICTSCAALLGLPLCQSDAEADPNSSVQLDWQRIDAEKGRQAGWTVFPMY